MSIQLNESDVKNIRQKIAKSILSPFFTGKISPKKMIHDLNTSLMGLGGDSFEKECNHFFHEHNKNKEIEISSQFSNTPREQIQQLIDATQVGHEQHYLLRKFIGDLKEEDIKHLLPEDKLILNKDVFYERLKKVDFKELTPLTEKRILEALIKDSIGLMKEEVILYYNLIKVNRLSSVVAAKQREKKTEDIARFQRMADALIEAYVPRFIKLADLKEFNENHSIDRATLRDAIIDKVKSGKFNPLPLITLAGIGKGRLMESLKKIIDQLSKKKNQETETIWKAYLFYMLFSDLSEEYIAKINISPNLISLLKLQRGKIQPSGIIIIGFTYMTFFNLCKQIAEIRAKYQKADDENKKKLYRLYANEERIAMLFNASVDVAVKNLDFHKGELSELSEFIKKYVKKTPIIEKSDLFG